MDSFSGYAMQDDYMPGFFLSHKAGEGVVIARRRLVIGPQAGSKRGDPDAHVPLSWKCSMHI